MDYLAARSKSKSVWNCESDFATEIRPICAKNGLWLGVGGSHTWTFLGNYNSQALDKVNVTPPPPPHPPPKKKKKKKKEKKGGIIGPCV